MSSWVVNEVELEADVDVEGDGRGVMAVDNNAASKVLGWSWSDRRSSGQHAS